MNIVAQRACDKAAIGTRHTASIAATPTAATTVTTGSITIGSTTNDFVQCCICIPQIHSIADGSADAALADVAGGAFNGADAVGSREPLALVTL